MRGVLGARRHLGFALHHFGQRLGGDLRDAIDALAHEDLIQQGGAPPSASATASAAATASASAFASASSSAASSGTQRPALGVGLLGRARLLLERPRVECARHRRHQVAQRAGRVPTEGVVNGARRRSGPLF